MEITNNGEQRQLVGNPPAVGDDFPHFKVFDKDGHKVKMKELLGKVTLLSVVPDINTPSAVSRPSALIQPWTSFQTSTF